jgi:flagellar protein FlgJ
MPSPTINPIISRQSPEPVQTKSQIRHSGISDKQADSNSHNSALKKACADMESLFIYYMLKEMRATVPKTGLMSGGKSEEIYTSMLDSHMAKELSRAGGIGLSSILLNQIGGDSIVKNGRSEK